MRIQATISPMSKNPSSERHSRLATKLRSTRDEVAVRLRTDGSASGHHSAAPPCSMKKNPSRARSSSAQSPPQARTWDAPSCPTSCANAGSRARLVASTLEANHDATWAEIPSGPLVLLPDLGSLPPIGLPLHGPQRLRDSQLRSGSLGDRRRQALHVGPSRSLRAALQAASASSGSCAHKSSKRLKTSSRSPTLLRESG